MKNVARKSSRSGINPRKISNHKHSKPVISGCMQVIRCRSEKIDLSIVITVWFKVTNDVGRTHDTHVKKKNEYRQVRVLSHTHTYKVIGLSKEKRSEQIYDKVVNDTWEIH